jgi:hypothetical protein
VPAQTTYLHEIVMPTRHSFLTSSLTIEAAFVDTVRDIGSRPELFIEPLRVEQEEGTP